MQRRRSRSAVGLVEYSLIVSLIAVALIIVLALVGTGVVGVFQNVINGLEGKNSTPPSSLVITIINLDVTTPGDLGSSILPSVTVTGPGYNQVLTASATLSNLASGTYHVAANPVVATPSQYSVPVTFYPSITPAGVSAALSSDLVLANGGIVTATVDYANAVPASTHALTGPDLALLTSYSGDSSSGFTLVFSSLPTDFVMAIGDTLMAGVSSSAPNGFLAKVTAINGNTISASSATFSDAFGRADFTGTTTISASLTTPLISALSARAAATGIHAAPFSIGCGNNSNVDFSGGDGVSFQPSMTLQLNWPWLSQYNDKFGFFLGETDHWQFSIDTSGSLEVFCNASVPLTDTLVGAYPIPVPVPFPIIITPELSLVATLSITWTPTTHPWLVVDGTATGSIGFICDHTGCKNLSSWNTFPATFNTQGSGLLKVKLGPRIAIKIDNIAGPYFAVYAYAKFTDTTNISPTCYNEEIGVDVSQGFVIGVGGPIPNPFSNIWTVQMAEQESPLACVVPVIPAFAPSSPIVEAGSVDLRGCDLTRVVGNVCHSNDGNNYIGDTTGTGQIQLNPDNSLPRYTRETELSATFHFPLHFTPTVDSNLYGQGCFHSVPTTDCAMGLFVAGRTWTKFGGGIFGAVDVLDGNGWSYTPTDAALCGGESTPGPYPCNDVTLFGAGPHGYTGPGADGNYGCGGNECVTGGNIVVQCKTAAGINDTCAGHTLIIHIYIESGGKFDYSGGGSQNYPEQPMGWFDGVTMYSDHSGGNGIGGGNYFINSNAASGDWHCSPAGDSNNTIYPGSPCPG
jgi:Flp pilus assembly pilin Flp